jgi:HD superfamily phosphohydrolase YqeK
MSCFDKIIYMADYVEPFRDFEGVEELRQLTFDDIDKAVIKGIDTTIMSLIDEGGKISPLMLSVRNGLIDTNST